MTGYDIVFGPAQRIVAGSILRNEGDGHGISSRH